jgi:hypothetical protein
VQGSWGFCPSAALGFWCPGCGGLRAAHHLTDLDLAAAVSSNLVLVLLAPLAVAWFVWWTVRRWRGDPPPRLTRRDVPGLTAGGAAAVLLLVAFAVVRNTDTALGLYLAP